MRVLISGAGVAGSTLANVLARSGAHITVLEKSPAMLPHGQNVDIQGAAVTAIKRMGLLRELERHNTTEKGTQFVNPGGQPFALFPVREGSIASLTSQYEILRADLALILYNAAKEHANVNFLFDTTIKQVIANDDDGDSVCVELSSGVVERYDILVAADGQWSRVRRQCFPDDIVDVKDMGMFVAYYTIPRTPSDNDMWNIYLALGRRIVTLRPDPHGTIRAMLSCMPVTAAQKQQWQSAIRSDKERQKALVRREFADVGWQAQRLLDAVDDSPDFYFQAMQQIRMAKWSKNRIICLGDAAYAPTPLTGIGTSLAITGAYILAGELAQLGEDEHPSKAFDAYEAVFRPHVEKMQQVPWVFPGLAHPTTAWQRWLLQTFMAALSVIVSRVLSISWVAARLATSNEENDDGFPLPAYPGLDSQSVEKVSR